MPEVMVWDNLATVLLYSSGGNSYSGRSQLPCGKANQTARWRSSGGKELRPSTNSHENEPFWKQIF